MNCFNYVSISAFIHPVSTLKCQERACHVNFNHGKLINHDMNYEHLTCSLQTPVRCCSTVFLHKLCCQYGQYIWTEKNLNKHTSFNIKMFYLYPKQSHQSKILVRWHYLICCETKQNFKCHYFIIFSCGYGYGLTWLVAAGWGCGVETNCFRLTVSSASDKVKTK